MERSATGRILTVVVIAALALVGCSSDDQAASTCQDLQGLASEVRGLADVNIVQTGFDGLQTQLDAIDQAYQKAKTSGEDQFGGQLDALQGSFESLGTTISSATDGGRPISETVSALESDIQSIETSWNNLTSAVDTELGSCDLAAIDT